jgi:hypothetical protein
MYPVGVQGSFITLMLLMNKSYFAIPPAPNLLIRSLANLLGLLHLAFGAYMITQRIQWGWTLVVFEFVLLVFYGSSKTVVAPHYYSHLEIFAKISWWAGTYLILTSIGKLISTCHNTQIGWVSGVMVFIPSLILYPWGAVSGNIAVEDTRLIDASIKRQIGYRNLAQMLESELPSGTMILMPEIGELGFYIENAVVLDACGLISPEAIPYLPVSAHLRPRPTAGVIPPQMVRDYQPDLLISLNIFGRHGLFKEDWFHDTYSLVLTSKGDWLPWGSQALYVFSRNDFSPGLQLIEASNQRDLSPYGSGHE